MPCVVTDAVVCVQQHQAEFLQKGRHLRHWTQEFTFIGFVLSFSQKRLIKPSILHPDIPPDTFLEPAEGGAGAEEALRHAASRAQEQSKGAGAGERTPPTPFPAKPLSQGPTPLLPPRRRPRRPPGRTWQRSCPRRH